MLTLSIGEISAATWHESLFNWIQKGTAQLTSQLSSHWSNLTPTQQRIALATTVTALGLGGTYLYKRYQQGKAKTSNPATNRTSVVTYSPQELNIASILPKLRLIIINKSPQDILGYLKINSERLRKEVTVKKGHTLCIAIDENPSSEDNEETYGKIKILTMQKQPDHVLLYGRQRLFSDDNDKIKKITISEHNNVETSELERSTLTSKNFQQIIEQD